MIKIVVKSVLKPGSWEKLTPLYRELLEKTHQEKGCIEYSLFIDTKDENICYMIETWENEEALTAHGNSEHFKRIVPQFAEFSAERSEMHSLRAFE
ncbi:MAG: antibiotic biosynthesis monooxygenase [Peptococcaceae bacterium]|jgi:quinol monooxygenase YgiN|nr:antibiotic biosynthesis monooxygenase [Peptococcaceae bacterium]